MRITLLSHFPGRGGSTSWLVQLERLFRSRGHETTVVVSADSPDPQVETYQVFQGTAGSNWRQRLDEYRAFVASTRPDAIYMVSGIEEGDLMRFLPYPRVRHVFALEEHPIFNAPYWTRQLLPYWEAGTANTPDVFELLRKLGPCDFEEIFTPYWVGPAFYRLRDVPFRPLGQRPIEVCCIGRIENYQKRMHWLPEIVESCRSAGRDLVWHIYGAGPGEDQLRDSLMKKGCLDIVHLHGWTREEDIAKLAPQHDVFFSCSRFEGLPVALQQAMFCGLHCVAPDLPAGIHYVVENGGVAGYKARSPQSCVRALLESTADREWLAERKVRTRELAFKLFGPDVVERQYLRLEAVIRELRFNGRVLDIRRAPKVRWTPVWTYLRTRLFAGAGRQAH